MQIVICGIQRSREFVGKHTAMVIVNQSVSDLKMLNNLYCLVCLFFVISAAYVLSFSVL